MVFDQKFNRHSFSGFKIKAVKDILQSSVTLFLMALARGLTYIMEKQGQEKHVKFFHAVDNFSEFFKAPITGSFKVFQTFYCKESMFVNRIHMIGLMNNKAS